MTLSNFIFNCSRY